MEIGALLPPAQIGEEVEREIIYSISPPELEYFGRKFAVSTIVLPQRGKNRMTLFLIILNMVTIFYYHGKY
jgi:hypothetical protein